MDTNKKTANQEISSWLATVGSDTPLQHSNPASLYLASLQGSEASRTTARSVMKQIAVLCDQTPDSFPWHRQAYEKAGVWIGWAPPQRKIDFLAKN